MTKSTKQENIWEILWKYARWTPSPHNIQPWKFRTESAHKATIYYDPTRLIPDTDPEGKFTTIGFGILLESLRIVASHHGFVLTWNALETKLDRYAKDTVPFFALTLIEMTEVTKIDTPSDSLNPELILSRRTSRLPYKTEKPVSKTEKPVSQSLLSELKDIAQHYGHQWGSSQEKSRVSWLLHLNCDTLFYDMDDPLTRNEILKWLRFSERESNQKQDGLSACCMRLPGTMLRLFFLQRWLLTIPLVKLLIKRFYYHTQRGTTTVAWLTGPMHGQSDWINAGQMLCRMWLIMTREEVYLHPFGSIITNPVAHARLDAHLKEHLSLPATSKGSDPLWFVLRMGYSDLPPKSKRLDPEQLLVEREQLLSGQNNC